MYTYNMYVWLTALQLTKNTEEKGKHLVRLKSSRRNCLLAPCTRRKDTGDAAQHKDGKAFSPCARVVECVVVHQKHEVVEEPLSMRRVRERDCARVEQIDVQVERGNSVVVMALAMVRILTV